MKPKYDFELQTLILSATPSDRHICQAVSKSTHKWQNWNWHYHKCTLWQISFEVCLWPWPLSYRFVLGSNTFSKCYAQLIRLRMITVLESLALYCSRFKSRQGLCLLLCEHPASLRTVGGSTQVSGHAITVSVQIKANKQTNILSLNTFYRKHFTAIEYQ